MPYEQVWLKRSVLRRQATRLYGADAVRKVLGEGQASGDGLETMTRWFSSAWQPITRGMQMVRRAVFDDGTDDSDDADDTNVVYVDEYVPCSKTSSNPFSNYHNDFVELYFQHMVTNFTCGVPMDVESCVVTIANPRNGGLLKKQYTCEGLFSQYL